jgi:hypothetical protein
MALLIKRMVYKRTGFGGPAMHWADSRNLNGLAKARGTPRRAVAAG